MGRLHQGRRRDVRDTDTDYVPSIVVKSNDKKRARVIAMRHVLSKFDCDGKDHKLVGEPDPLIVGRVLEALTQAAGQERRPRHLLLEGDLNLLAS
jgi:hypothetical protein